MMDQVERWSQVGIKAAAILQKEEMKKETIDGKFYGHNHGLGSAYLGDAAIKYNRLLTYSSYYMTCVIIFMLLSLYNYAQPQLTALLLNNACTNSVYMLQGKTGGHCKQLSLYMCDHSFSTGLLYLLFHMKPPFAHKQCIVNESIS